MNYSVNLQTYMLQGTIPCILSAAFLFIFIALDRTFSRRILKLFIAAASCTLILSLSEVLDCYLLFHNSRYFLRRILAALSYSSRINTIAIATMIAVRRSRLQIRILSASAILNTLLSFASIWTGIIFYIAPDQTWSRGILFCLPYLICVYCVVVLLYEAVAKVFSNRIEAVTVLLLLAVCGTANAFELFREIRFVLSTGLIISVIFYYLCLNVQLYRRDPLTELLNRRSFYMDLHRHSQERFAVISMDINNFKKINDTKGHSEGDRAIQKAAELIEVSFRNYGLVYRTGGDEFAAIIKERFMNNLDEITAAFKNRVLSSGISIAAGRSDYYPGDNQEQVIAIADFRMYQNKSSSRTALTEDDFKS